MDNHMMFYTYIHTTPYNKVFYVGKGTKERAYSKSDRSIAWRNVVSKHAGYGTIIASEWESEDEAFEHERFLIACFKDLGHELVNATSGGRGANDYCVSEEVRRLKSLKQTGYKHKIITCPKCGTSGGETSMKRWHFEKCRGAKKVRARVTVDGKRIHLGKYETKESAELAIKVFKESI